jgi:hypothetical protein
MAVKLVYPSITRSSQSLSLPAGAAVTFVTNCATSTQTPASRPALKDRETSSMVSDGVLMSSPAFIPTRRRPVSTTPED